MPCIIKMEMLLSHIIQWREEHQRQQAVQRQERLLRRRGIHSENHHHPSTDVICTPSTKNPLVTLFYDADKQLTVAVLAKSNAEVQMYLRKLVRQGAATQRSALYFELDGFVRPHWTALRQIIKTAVDTVNGDNSAMVVQVAMGSLEASDGAHQKQLQQERARRQAQMRNTDDDDARLSDPDLELAWDICRQHRLQDDLDIVTLTLLRLCGNRMLARLAARMMQKRLRGLELQVVPFVDGIYLPGYSNFVRNGSVGNGSNTPPARATDSADADTPEDGAASVSTSTPPERVLRRHVEGGRLVEYQMLPGISLCAANIRQGIFVTSDHHHQQQHPGHKKCGFSSPSCFAWHCEELTLAHLHRWWGDITVRDYIGQKLWVQFYDPHPTAAALKKSDIVLEQQEEDDGNNSKWKTLATIRLDLGPPRGVHMLPRSDQHYNVKRALQSSMPHLVQVQLHTKECAVLALDSVTTLYSGCCEVRSVHVQWSALARVAACQALPQLRAAHERIQEQRPLLTQEVDYYNSVLDLASCM